MYGTFSKLLFIFVANLQQSLSLCQVYHKEKSRFYLFLT